MGTPNTGANKAAFRKMWTLIALMCRGKNVWFDLMNEPHDQDMI
jgi:hypothetical protein